MENTDYKKYKNSIRISQEIDLMLTAIDESMNDYQAQKTEDGTLEEEAFTDYTDILKYNLNVVKTAISNWRMGKNINGDYYEVDDEEDYNDYDDGTEIFEDETEWQIDMCRKMEDGQCLKAGSEYCDFECPFRN